MGGDRRAPGEMGADRDEDRIEAVLGEGRLDVLDLAVELQRHAHGEDARDLGVEHFAGEAVFRDAEAHHAARHRPGLADRHGMAEPGEVIGGREPAGARADHQHPLAGRLRLEGRHQPFADRVIAEESLHGMDAHRRVELGPVAGRFAGMIADPPHDRRQGIVLHQALPGGGIIAALGLEEPFLDVLPGRAGVVAGRQPVDIDRPLGAPRTGVVLQARSGIEGDGEGQGRVLHGLSSAGSSP